LSSAKSALSKILTILELKEIKFSIVCVMTKLQKFDFGLMMMMISVCKHSLQNLISAEQSALLHLQ
jgi:hypothetical protein